VRARFSRKEADVSMNARYNVTLLLFILLAVTSNISNTHILNSDNQHKSLHPISMGNFNGGSLSINHHINKSDV